MNMHPWRISSTKPSNKSRWLCRRACRTLSRTASRSSSCRRISILLRCLRTIIFSLRRLRISSWRATSALFSWSSCCRRLSAASLCLSSSSARSSSCRFLCARASNSLARTMSSSTNSIWTKLSVLVRNKMVLMTDWMAAVHSAISSASPTKTQSRCAQSTVTRASLELSGTFSIRTARASSRGMSPFAFLLDAFLK